METRTVYRVEHADHCSGPFDLEGSWTLHHVMAEAGAADEDADDPFHNSYNGFPGPGNDPRLRDRWWNGDLNGRVCGCRSEDDLGTWFPAPLADYLDRQGYELTVWRVPRKFAAYGRNQVLFDRDRAECVARRSVSSLHT